MEACPHLCAAEIEGLFTTFASLVWGWCALSRTFWACFVYLTDKHSVTREEVTGAVSPALYVLQKVHDTQ